MHQGLVCWDCGPLWFIMSICKTDRKFHTFSDRYVGLEWFRDFIYDHIKPRSNISCERWFDRHDVIWIVEDTSQGIFCLDSLRYIDGEGKGCYPGWTGTYIIYCLLEGQNIVGSFPKFVEVISARNNDNPFIDGGHLEYAVRVLDRPQSLAFTSMYVNGAYAVISFLDEFMSCIEPFKSSDVRRENSRISDCGNSIEL